MSCVHFFNLLIHGRRVPDQKKDLTLTILSWKTSSNWTIDAKIIDFPSSCCAILDPISLSSKSRSLEDGVKIIQIAVSYSKDIRVYTLWKHSEVKSSLEKSISPSQSWGSKMSQVIIYRNFEALPELVVPTKLELFILEEGMKNYPFDTSMSP